MRWLAVPFVSFFLVFAVWSHGQAVQPGSPSALERLRLTEPRVQWDPKSAISGNFTCAGISEKVFAGYSKNRVWVGLVSSSGKTKPIIVDFPAATPVIGQDAFCAARVAIDEEPRDCLGEGDVPLPGCRRIKRCVAFRVYDGECDSFHFYWDNRRKRLTYWRL